MTISRLDFPLVHIIKNVYAKQAGLIPTAIEKHIVQIHSLRNSAEINLFGKPVTHVLHLQI